MASLRTFNVKHCAEDNRQLMELYKDKTRSTDAEVEGAGAENTDWIMPDPFLVWGPFDHTAAVFIKGSGGTVSILKGNECIRSFSDADMSDDVTMVLLEPGYYCWSMKGSRVKLVRRPG